MSQQPEELIVAFASDDGIHLVERHFGDAGQFDIYRLSRDESRFARSVCQAGDETEENDSHGAARKAHGVSALLAPDGVKVLVNRAFGPNIKRMVKRFMPVVVDCITIEDAIETLQSHYGEIANAWAQGEDRKHLVLRRQIDS